MASQQINNVADININNYKIKGMPTIKNDGARKPQPKAEIPNEVLNTNKEQVKVNKQPRVNNFKGNKKPKYHKPKASDLVPKNISEEQGNIVMIVLHNQGIKRHTALNILQRFEEDGFIISAKGAYVEFDWYKIKVTGPDKLSKEYSYKEPFFIEALANAHAQMSADSQRVIEAFISAENIEI